MAIKTKTKIIATVGPASIDFKVFKELVKAEVDYLRINTAYSTSDQHLAIFSNLKKLKADKKIEIIYDIRSKEKVAELDLFKDFLIALSFTETKKQLEDIKKMSPKSRIISKIESEKGLKNFQEILEASWGIMVARGDLGIAVSLERVPCVQKKISEDIKDKGKFLIIATEMLLSMVHKTTPTRAEVSDVANAVFEGASAVMLSEETAIGKHPVEAVNYMKKIIKATEDCINNKK